MPQARKPVPIGAEFGALTIVAELAPRPVDTGTRRMFLVRCACGRERTVLWGNLRRGNTLSCGCHAHRLRYRRG